MIKLRASQDRGHTTLPWLSSHHSFSFGDYIDPLHRGYETLRVINEDFVKRGAGFDTHPHKDMEIITIVLEGSLAHEDSMGNTSIINPFDVQRMTAGLGVTHSEYNNSNTESLHLFQIWIYPNQRGLLPSYEQKNFGEILKEEGLHLVAGPTGEQNAVYLHQESYLWLGHLKQKSYTFTSRQPKQYIHIIKGSICIEGTSSHQTLQLEGGDGAYIEGESSMHLNASNDALVILFDLAPLS